MEDKKKKLLLIGPIPFPKGGVSMHIQRLAYLMEEYFQIDYIDESRNKKEEYFNIRTFNIFKYLALVANADIVHIHSGVQLLRIFHIICAKLLLKKVVITIHNSRKFSNKTLFILEKILMKYLIEVSIFVNKDIVELFKIKKYYLLPAFIPPIQSLEEELPENILNIIKNGRELNSTIIVANAWRLENHCGKDLYGLDLCIKLTQMLKFNNRNALFIFNVATLEKYKEKFTFYKNLIREKGLEYSFELLNEDMSFVKLIVASDIVLRPTLTDGDALTIREAIYLNRHVIASDVVERPKETILYETGNIEDLYNKILSVLDTDCSYSGIDNFSTDYYKNLYYNIYNETISTKH